MSKKQFYVYVIYVDGVVRYIGKGSNGPLNLGLAAATIILAWTVTPMVFTRRAAALNS